MTYRKTTSIFRRAYLDENNDDKQGDDDNDKDEEKANELGIPLMICIESKSNGIPAITVVQILASF